MNNNQIIQEKSVREAAVEALEHLSTVRAETGRMRGVLFDEHEEERPDEKAVYLSLESAVRKLSQQCAMLAGEMRTINNRLDGEPVPTPTQIGGNTARRVA